MSALLLYGLFLGLLALPAVYMRRRGLRLRRERILGGRRRGEYVFEIRNGKWVGVRK